MIPFTYLVKHVPTNRYYYGVKFGKKCHPYDLWTKYFTSSKKVKGLIRRYGKKSFIFEIRKTFKTAQQARVWEHKVLKRLKVVYRNDFLNQSDNKQMSSSKEARRKISLANTGKKRSEEMIIRMRIYNSGKNNGMYGKKHSEKTIKKLSKLNKGKKLSEETKEKLRFYSGKNHYMYGKKLSEETKEKIRLGNLGKKHTEEMIKYLSKINKGKNNPMYGRRHSKETNKKMRFAWEKRRAV
jgi:hypothetical protein